MGHTGVVKKGAILGYVGFRVSKIRGTCLRVTKIRIIAFWGPYWGSRFGKLPNDARRAEISTGIVTVVAVIY